MIHTNYIPLFNLRKSEMEAYEELPDSDKDSIIPLVALRPWLTSKTIDKAIGRVQKSVGNRPWFVDIDVEDLFSDHNKDKSSESRTALKNCCSPLGGYSDYYELVEQIEKAIPVLRLETINSIDDQMLHVERLSRGFAVRIRVSELSSFEFSEIIRRLADHDCRNGLMIIDRGDLPRGSLANTTVAEMVKLVNMASTALPHISIAVSSTSFPYDFKDISDGEQTIYERQLYFKIAQNCDCSLIYSDWASARQKALSGGAGLPPPRVDYPLRNEWKFKRRTIESNDDKDDAYVSIARELMSEKYWQKNVRVWGTQMIEKTAAEDPYGIYHAGKATAVRINIHLHTQLHYDVSELETVDTDEEWVD